LDLVAVQRHLFYCATAPIMKRTLRLLPLLLLAIPFRGLPGKAQTPVPPTFSVYAVPAHDHLTVAAPLLRAGDAIELRDAHGRVVQRATGGSNGRTDLSVGDLAPGVYSVQWRSPAGLTQRTVVVL
jgi:hypothetical protein